MTRLKPLARFIYASAFFIPFAWTATGHSLLLSAEPMEVVEAAAYTVPIGNNGTIDIVALANLDDNPTVITAEEREMIALLLQVLQVPAQDR